MMTPREQRSVTGDFDCEANKACPTTYRWFLKNDKQQENEECDIRLGHMLTTIYLTHQYSREPHCVVMPANSSGSMIRLKPKSAMKIFMLPLLSFSTRMFSNFRSEIYNKVTRQLTNIARIFIQERTTVGNVLAMQVLHSFQHLLDDFGSVLFAVHSSADEL